MGGLSWGSLEYCPFLFQILLLVGLLNPDYLEFLIAVQIGPSKYQSGCPPLFLFIVVSMLLQKFAFPKLACQKLAFLMKFWS